MIIENQIGNVKDIPYTEEKSKSAAKAQETIFANGYELTPVRGKGVHIDGWQSGEMTLDRYRKLKAKHPDHKSAGLRCGKLRPADIDVWNPNEAKDIRRIITDILGNSPLERFGRKGSALIYACDEALPKASVKGLPPVEHESKPESDRSKADRPGKLEGVEFLGAGNQLVAFGVHPNSGKSYAWRDNKSPLHVPVSELPVITRAQIERVLYAVEDHMAFAGWSRIKVSLPWLEKSGSTPTGEPLLESQVLDMLSHVMPDCDRNAWLAIAAAIKCGPITDASGDDILEDRREEIFVSWSRGDFTGAQPSNFTGDGDCIKAFGSMTDKQNGAHIGSLIQRAQDGGYEGFTSASQVNVAAFFESDEALSNLEDIGKNGSPQKDQKSASSVRQASRFPVLNDEAMDAEPELDWQIEYVFPKAHLILIYGEEQSFKSLLLQDALMCGAANIPWAPGDGHTGFRVADDRPLNCVFIVGEGQKGVMKRRRPAWRKAHPEVKGKIPFYVIKVMPNFTKDVDVDDLISSIEVSECPKPDFIAIDTLIYALGGASDSDIEKTAKVFAAAQRLIDHFGCDVAVVHHSGKDPTKGARGSSDITFSSMVRFKTEKGPGWTKENPVIILVNEKMKDEDPLPDMCFTFRKIQLGTDKNGKPVNSIVPVRIGLPKKPESELKTPEGHSPILEEAVTVLASLEPGSLHSLRDVAERMTPETLEGEERRKAVKATRMKLARRVNRDSANRLTRKLYGDILKIGRDGDVEFMIGGPRHRKPESFAQDDQAPWTEDSSDSEAVDCGRVHVGNVVSLEAEKARRDAGDLTGTD